MLNIRKYLAELMGVNKISDDDIRRELDELKIDNQVEQLTRDGHIVADPEIQALTRKAIQGQAAPEDILKLITAPRPAPANATVVTPPAGPTAGVDQVEAQIQAEMAKSGTAYHVAAMTVAAGGSIHNQPAEAPTQGGE